VNDHFNTQQISWSSLTKRFSIYFVLILLIIISSLINPNFLSANNISNVARQISVTTILAFGETILIICGLLDLSSGSVLALSGLLSVASYKATGSMLLAILIAVAIAVFCNLLSAIIVTRFSVPSFIATLAMQEMARGSALLFSKGQNIYQIGDYTILGQGSIGPIPIPILFLIGFMLITWYTLNQTRFGRALYAIGGNQEAAQASGIAVNRTKTLAFLFNGLIVGIAGVLFMSRVNAGLPNGGINYEFQALTSSIIGGTSFSGGVGTAGGTLVGALIVGFLNNIMNLASVNSYMQQIVRGAIIALAVMYDISAKSRQSKLFARLKLK
jgi:inositol transport system permease protein